MTRADADPDLASYCSDDGGRQRLTVLHVINRVSAHGGAEVSLVENLLRLEPRGVHNVVIPLFSYEGDAVLQRLRRAGVEVVDPLDLPGWRTVPKIVGLLRAHRPDLVHTTLFEADVYGRVAALLAGIPAVTSVVNMQYDHAARQGHVAPWKLAMVRRVDSWLARHATYGVHAITDAVATSAVEHLRLDPARVTVVPRGRDREALGQPPRRSRADLWAALGLPPDSDVLLNVARHEPQKGQVHLIRSLALLVEHRPKLQLLIAGRSGTTTDSLLAEAARLGVADRVHLLGVRGDVFDLLGACDVFVFSSRWEGLGGAVLEAMALGAPVVAFDIPPVREVLGGTGLLVTPGDERAFAGAVLEVLNDPGARASLTARACERFDSCYELGVVADQTERMYRQLVESAARRESLPRALRVAELLAGTRRPGPAAGAGPARDAFRERYESVDVVAEYTALSGLTAVEEYLVQRWVARGSRVLDVGVGSGRTTGMLAARASRYVGVDISSAMVEASRRAFPELEFRQGDAADLSPYADESFDAVVFSFNGIDHLPRPARAAFLSEARRVLAPNGVLLFSGHNPRSVLVLPRPALRAGRPWPRYALSAAYRTVNRVRRRLPSQSFWRGEGTMHEQVHGGFELHVATPRVWRRLVEGAGFRLLESEHADYPVKQFALEANWTYLVFART